MSLRVNVRCFFLSVMIIIRLTLTKSIVERAQVVAERQPDAEEGEFDEKKKNLVRFDRFDC